MPGFIIVVLKQSCLPLGESYTCAFFFMGTKKKRLIAEKDGLTSEVIDIVPNPLAVAVDIIGLCASKLQNPKIITPMCHW